MKCRTATALALLFAGASVALAQAPAAPAPNDNTTARPGVRTRGGAGRAGASGFGGNRGLMRGVPRVTGEITKVEGTVYTVRTMRGETVKVTVPAGAQIMKADRTAGTKADLKVGARINAMGTPPATPPANDATPPAGVTPGNRGITPENLTASRVMVLSPMAQGVIQTISARAITLRLPDGKTATYTIDTATRFMQNRQPATWSAFKGGENVTVEYTGRTATIIRNAMAMGQGRGAGMGQGRQGAGARVRRNAPGTAGAPGATNPPTTNRPGSGPRPADDVDNGE